MYVCFTQEANRGKKKKSKYIQFAFLKMADKMSTVKLVHEFSTLFIWFLSKLDRFYQLAKSDLYGA